MGNSPQKKVEFKVKVPAILRVEGFTELENVTEYNLDSATIFKIGKEWHLLIIGEGTILERIKCTDREHGKEMFRLMFEKSKEPQGIVPKWKERPEAEESRLVFYRNFKKAVCQKKID